MLRDHQDLSKGPGAQRSCSVSVNPGAADIRHFPLSHVPGPKMFIFFLFWGVVVESHLIVLRTIPGSVFRSNLGGAQGTTGGIGDQTIVSYTVRQELTLCTFWPLKVIICLFNSLLRQPAGAGVTAACG